MEISKESFLMAEDSKTRDVILFDMMSTISTKIDQSNTIEKRVEECEGSILYIKGIGTAVTVLFGGLAAWFKTAG